MQPSLDPERMVDLSGRWLRARRAAALKVTGELAEAQDELGLVARAVAANEQDAMRQVFSHSHALGNSYRRFFKTVPALQQWPDFLAALATPCLAGRWSTIPACDGALRLTRGGCAWGVDARLCDWWREAADGLVLGVSGVLRHTRHRSRGHGDGDCQDVLFEDVDGAPRYGDIPPQLQPSLQAIHSQVRLWDSAARLEWLGLSEGVLLYRLTRVNQDAGLALNQMVEQQLGRRIPNVKIQELAPRAVFSANGE